MKAILILFFATGLAQASAPLVTMDDVNSKYETGKLNPMNNFTPSVINSMEDLNKIFYSLDNTNKWTAKPNTQCFNRAHYWAKSMKDGYGIDSMKVHIYYTRKYAANISGKWWFHVAPMVNMNGELYVLDETFINRPVVLADWEKKFTRKMYRGGDLKNYRCKVIENISEYYDEDNQKNEYCNIHVSSMYYWKPSELEKLEKENAVRTEFSALDLQTAVKNIFWHWQKIYNRLKL